MARRDGGEMTKGKRRLTLLFLGLVAVAIALLGAAPAFAALTPEQEALARKIDGELIAPCCWTQTVADHQSDIATQMKAQTRALIAQGKTESEILDSYVASYGPEILASPRARGFNLLAYVLPFAVFLVAGTAIVVLVRRWHKNSGSDDLAVIGVPSDGSAGQEREVAVDDAVRTQLERELSNFDR